MATVTFMDRVLHVPDTTECRWCGSPKAAFKQQFRNEHTATYNCPLCEHTFVIDIELTDEQWLELNKPAVGDGMTLVIATDTEPYTVTHVSPDGKTIRLQQDKAVRVNREDDEVTPGGFFAHTESPKGQVWEFTRDEGGRRITATWRAGWRRYKLTRCASKGPGFWLSKGRSKHYDYNY